MVRTTGAVGVNGAGEQGVGWMVRWETDERADLCS